MDPSESIKLVLLGLFLLLNALMSAAETALISVRTSRLIALEEQGSKAAARARTLLNHPDQSLAGIQFANLLSTVFGAGLTTSLFLIWYPEREIIVTILLAGAATLGAFMLFGELVPKTIARRHSETVTLALIMPVVVITYFLTPVVSVLILIANGFTRLIPGLRPLARNPYVTEEEIKVLVEKGEEMGDLEEDEREMVNAIFDLDRRVAREVMVPRVDMIGADVNSTLDDLLDIVLSSGHTRLPIHEGSSDNIIGILNAKDLLRYLRHGKQGFNARRLLRPAYFVPESKNAKVLLEEMRDRRVPFTVVVDEYGGTAGIVTLEDLLEEIVGEIRDEYDIEEDAIVRLGEDAALVDARAPIDEIDEDLDLNLPTEEYDSIGGFVIGLFGEVPDRGREATWDAVRFIVENVNGNRIRSLRIIVNRETGEPA